MERARRLEREEALAQYNHNISRRQVFISELDDATTEESARQHFSSLGLIVVDVFIHRRNITGRSLGTGYVTFADERDVFTVLAANHRIDGRQIKVEKYEVGCLPIRAVPHTILVKFAEGNTVTTREMEQHFSRQTGDSVSAWIDPKNNAQAKVKFSGESGKEFCIDRALSLGAIQHIAGHKVGVARCVFFDKEQLEAEKKSRQESSLARRRSHSGSEQGASNFAGDEHGKEKRDAEVHEYNCSLAPRQVFISELHPNTTEASVRQYFSSLGVVVVEAYVRRYKRTAPSLCNGYVTLMSEPEVATVLASTHEIDGKQICVEQYQVGFLPVRSLPHSLLVKVNEGNTITPRDVQHHFSELCGDRVSARIDPKDPNQYKVKFSGQPSKERCIDHALSHGATQRIGSINVAVTRSIFFTRELAEKEKRGRQVEAVEEYNAQLCPRRVFITDLSPQSTEESIREYFTDFGVIVVEAIVIRFKGTDLSMRSCLVTFLNEKAVSHVLEPDKNGRRQRHIIDGQRAHVMPNRPNSAPLRVFPYTLYVSFNEDEPLTKKQLEHYFRQQSGDDAVSVQPHGRHPGNAIVTFSGAPGKETCIDAVLAMGSAQSIDSVMTKVNRYVFYVTSKTTLRREFVKDVSPRQNGEEVAAQVLSRESTMEGRLASPFYGKRNPSRSLAMLFILLCKCFSYFSYAMTNVLYHIISYDRLSPRNVACPDIHMPILDKTLAKSFHRR